jgi:predicted porin
MNTPQHKTNKAIIGAAVAAALSAAAGAADALEAKVSGHLNRMIINVDDGTQSETFHADNGNSQTRLRFTGTQEVMPGLTAGVNWEVGYSSNLSSSLNMTNRSADANFNERHVDAYLLGRWGKVSLGQSDGAANGAMEVDLSGTSVISYSSVTDIGSSFAFRQGDTFGPTIGATIGSLDFESRYDRVRYDTPAFGPVTLSVSHGTKGNNDVAEAAAWFASDFAFGKVAAALGWSREDRGGVTGNEDTIGGSVSWLAPVGVSVTLGYSNSEVDDPAVPKKKFGYGKVGYKVGNHAVSVDYAVGNDFDRQDDESKMVGLGYVYTPQKWIDLYAGVKQHSLDRVGSNFDDVRFVSAGTRIKF